MRWSVLSLLLICVVACGKKTAAPAASLISASRNGSHRVSIVELRRVEDGDNSRRNFEIWLERVSDGFRTNIYRSRDEGGRSDTDRILWRDDHSQFVVLGRNFIVRESPNVPMETLYLLYDVPSGKVRCNSIQAAEPGFSQKELGLWRGSYENDELRSYTYTRPPRAR
jgi:hypothetical protein